MRETLTDENPVVKGLTGTGGHVQLVNNLWNIQDLVYGRDFTQTVTYDPTDLTRNVDLDWDFGPAQLDRVLSYPEISFGESAWSRDGSTELVSRVDAVRDLDVTVDLTLRGDADKFNVAFDMWLTDTALGGGPEITTELMVWLHTPDFPPAGDPVATWTSNGMKAKVYVAEGFTAYPGTLWRYIAVDLDTEFLKGTIDLDGLLRFLVDQKLISADDYVGGVELGAEVTGGKGGMTINAVDLSHSAYRITEGADRLIGTAQDDVIAGRGGADLIGGREGADRLSGGAGADVLLGQDGRDQLSGGSGADRLNGGAAADILTGGGGADLFVFQRPKHLGSSSDCDRITDFGNGADRIDLRVIDADTGRAGNQAFDFIGSARFHGDAGELRAVRTGSTTLLSADLDGDGRADLWLHVTGVAVSGSMIGL